MLHVTKFEMKARRGTGKTQWLLEQVKKSKGTKVYIGTIDSYKNLADKYLRAYREAIKLPFLRLETELEKLTKITVFTDDCTEKDQELFEAFIEVLKAQLKYYNTETPVEVVWYNTRLEVEPQRINLCEDL